jgi:acetyl-CoA carboxylase biotin carboxylase subunit
MGVMRRALDELSIEGMPTTIALHRRIFRNKDFTDSRVDTTWIERVLLPSQAAIPS